MPNVSFLNLLQRTARGCGLNPAALSAELAECLATWLEARVRKVWHATLWPETLLLEQRTYSPTWTATSYADGDQVWSSTEEAYYIANDATTSGDVPGVSSKWDEDTPDHFITFTTTGQTVIGEPIAAYSADPRKTKAPGKVRFWHDGITLFLDPDAPAQPWILFRKAAPKLTATAWDAAATYAADAVIYYTDGHCYLVLAATTAGQDPADTPSKFAQQAIPSVLADYATRAAKADWLSDDGQDDRATLAERLAEGWINDRMADLTILQGQTNNYTVS